MSEPKRLHPIAILFNIFKSIKDLIVPIVFFTVLPGRDIGFPGYIRWLDFWWYLFNCDCFSCRKLAEIYLSC